MSINHPINLNLSSTVLPPVLHMAQYDANSRIIVATLWDGANPFTVPEGANVMLRFGKPDGTGGLYGKTEAGTTITYTGNVVTAPVATQMLSIAGVVYANIEIYQIAETEQGSVKLATFCFVVNVEKAAHSDAKIISSDYYNIISADIATFRGAQAELEETAKNLVSPTVTLQNTFASGMIPAVKVTITDKDGDHEFTIKDGKAGKNGTAGQHGDSVAVTVLPLNATEEHTSGGHQLTFKKTTYPSSGGSSISTENVQLWNGNNADISFGITGASVGQVLQIAAVDENGAPTAWEAV